MRVFGLKGEHEENARYMQVKAQECAREPERENFEFYILEVCRRPEEKIML
jgi:hypothetical protein